jgi:hypothetical protein
LGITIVLAWAPKSIRTGILEMQHIGDITCGKERMIDANDRMVGRITRPPVARTATKFSQGSISIV